MALKQFLSLEKRLLNQPLIYKQYSDFMKEYLSLKHIEFVPTNNLHLPHYYLPHHCVIKPDSLTTKLRVVFNASAKSANECSLNDCLHTGPKLQRDIFKVLLNFRSHTYMLLTDIKMMYRNISVNPSQVDFQRIIWRFNPNDSLQD